MEKRNIQILMEIIPYGGMLCLAFIMVGEGGRERGIGPASVWFDRLEQARLELTEILPPRCWD